MCRPIRESVWRFDTANFSIRLHVDPCPIDPADQFDSPEDVEAIESGRVEWFDASVVVYGVDSEPIGADMLGCCAYAPASDFWTAHRDRDPMNRNCSAMRAARGSNVVICHYFPEMVHLAVCDARRNLAKRATAYAGVKAA